jgi:hypothetical protein
MSKLPVLLVASALLTAACGAAATHSSSNAQPASYAGVQVNAGATADSDVSDITNRPNPPVRPGGSSQATPPATTKAATPPVGEPFRSGFDRCGGGIGTDLAGSRAGFGPGQKHPLPECAVQ